MKQTLNQRIQELALKMEKRETEGGKNPHPKFFYRGNVEVNAADEVPSLHCHDILSLCSTAIQVFPTLVYTTRVFFYFFFLFTGPTGNEEDTLNFQETAMAPSFPPSLNL